MRTRVNEQTLCKNNACVSVWTCRCVFVCTAMQGLKVSIKAAAAPGCCHTHPCWPVQYLRDPHSQNVGIGCKLLGEHGLHGFLIQFQLQLFIQIEVIQCPERPRLLLQSRTSRRAWVRCACTERYSPATQKTQRYCGVFIVFWWFLKLNVIKLVKLADQAVSVVDEFN